MLTTLHICVLLVIGSILVVMALFLRGQRLVIADLEERLEGLTEQVGFDDLTGVYRRTAGERRARLSLRIMPCIVLPVMDRATEALLGDEHVETDIVVAAYDRTVQVLSDLAQGEVKFDWALEMSSRPPIEPSGSLHAAMEEVRRIKLQRAFFKEAHRTIEEPRHV